MGCTIRSRPTTCSTRGSSSPGTKTSSASRRDSCTSAARAPVRISRRVTKRLRDGAGPMPASLVLAYPNLHSTPPPQSDALRAALTEGPLDFFTPAVMRDINLNYAGSEAVFDDVYAYPGNGDVSGLPPVFVLNSERDSLRASGERFGEQIAAAGGTVRVEY